MIGVRVRKEQAFDIRWLSPYAFKITYDLLFAAENARIDEIAVPRFDDIDIHKTLDVFRYIKVDFQLMYFHLLLPAQSFFTGTQIPHS